MKNFKFITGVICGAVLFGGASAIANEIAARLSNQSIYVGGQKIEMTAYSIADNNYIKLRDIGKAVNFGVTYDAETDTVHIDSNADYVEEIKKEPVLPEETALIPITEKYLDGTEWAREDFSLKANPAIFDDVYTRCAYNAIRQTIVDRDIILANNNENGLNLYYKYANYMPTQDIRRVVDAAYSSINCYYRFSNSIEPYIKNLFEYPDHSICKVGYNDFFIKPNKDTDSFINEVNKLGSDREKIIKLNNYLCDKLTYGDTGSYKMEDVFSSSLPIPGKCADYSYLFLYLCQRANIPCIMITGENHGWNAVYLEDKWLYVDVTVNDTSDAIDSRDSELLIETYPMQDERPKRTAFAKELLCPGSTK